MADFIDSLKNYFQERGLNIEKHSAVALRHALDMQTTGKEALFVYMNKNGDPTNKGIFIYEKDYEYVILGSVFINNKRNFKQLFVLTCNQSTNKLLDNTSNEIDANNIVDALVGWLKQ